VEQIITGVASLAKVKDLVSDIYFIIEISEFYGIFEDAVSRGNSVLDARRQF
jgi:hypothetical protein